MNFLIRKFDSLESRSKAAIKNAGLSLIMKGVSVLVSLLLVPMTLQYINPTRYGVWVAISSVITWIAFFDLGLGNGMRNKFAAAKASGDDSLARQYLSTAYVSVAAIVLVLYGILVVVNGFVDWAEILNIDTVYAGELHSVFIIVSLFACLNLVATLLTSFLAAEQCPGISSVISAIGQIISLVVLYLMTRLTEGNLVNLALYYSGIPCLTLVLATFVIFRLPSFRRYSPSLRQVRLKLVKDIMSLGLQFFVIYLALIFVFQITSLVVSRELGPEAVTQYSIAERYFNILYMTVCIIATPYWSGYTDAYVKGDTAWMLSTLKRLELFLLIVAGVGVVMLLVSGWFYHVWIKDAVAVPFALSVTMCIYSVSRCLGNVYTSIVNGLGAIRLQTILYVVGAVLAWPLITLSCRKFGVCGAAVFTAVICIIQAVVSRVQIEKLVKNTATGIWKK